MRVELFDTPVDILTMDETLAAAVDAMRAKKRCQHVAMNVAKLVNAKSDPELDRDVHESDIIGIDGRGILIALKLMGYDVPDTVSGVDLFQQLMRVCASRASGPICWAQSRNNLEKTMAELKARHPALEFAGARNGYFKPEEDAAVAAGIAASGADCLFIAMPTPRKERFMHAHRDTMGVPFLMGVGGTFDVIAGYVKRAPLVWQKLGLEWFYRMAQEPRRMFWRYARTNTLFAKMLAGALIRRMFSRGGHTA